MKTKMNLMKGIALTAIVFCATLGFAQKGNPEAKKEKRMERQNERKEDIETLKIGFLTKKLDLTPEEAQRFWPVYNQFNDKMQDIRKKRREDNKEAKQKFEELSDKEVELAVDNEMASRQKELDIQKEYHAKFKSVLPIKKVARLYNAEEQFKMELLNKLKDRKDPPPPHGPEGPPNPPRDKE